MILIGDGDHAQDIKSTLRTHLTVAHHSETPTLRPNDIVIIGINNPTLRAKVADELGVEDANWVHPDARTYHPISYGYGCHVNYGVSMVRTTLGNHVTISPGVTIAGGVTIGNRVLIGAGATICDRVTIEDDCVIGAGAVVTPELYIPAGSTVVGVPGRIAPRKGLIA